MGPTTIFIILLTLVCAALISGGGVYLAVRYFDKIKKADALTQAQIIVDSAKDEARRISERTQKDADELRALVDACGVRVPRILHFEWPFDRADPLPDVRRELAFFRRAVG